MCFKESPNEKREQSSTQAASVTRGRFRAPSHASCVSARPCHLGVYFP